MNKLLRILQRAAPVIIASAPLAQQIFRQVRQIVREEKKR
jgi:hypothetical protein